MNTKLSQDAHDTLKAYESPQAAYVREQRRHAQGYGPKPADPPMRTWAPAMNAQEKQQHDQYVIDNHLPF